MFRARMLAGLVLVAGSLFAAESASAQEASMSMWTWRIEVEVTHFSGQTYWSFGYETDDSQEAALVWMLFQSAFENGDLQGYYGSSTAYVSNIRCRRLSNLQPVSPSLSPAIR